MVPAKHGLDALSEKEKATLRLIVRGHDAKSAARSLGLSVHTINERLRDARRKLTVSSSRAAARQLFEAEGGLVAAPEPVGDDEIGGDPATVASDGESAPAPGARRSRRVPVTIGATMILALALALAAAPQNTPQNTPAPPAASPAAEAPKPAVVDAARSFLVLLDASNWPDSYRATGTAFRKLNTLQVWSAASEQARRPLGAVIARAFVSEQDLPAPPACYEVVKFRTSFANKAETTETVTLEREGGDWHVVGVIIG